MTSHSANHSARWLAGTSVVVRFYTKNSLESVSRSNATDKHDSLDIFCRLPCIEYWRSQLNSSNIKNLKTTSVQGGTKRCYTYGLFNFHKWLCGKQFEHTAIMRVNNNVVNMQKKTVIIKGIDHFLDLYQHDALGRIEFIVLIKKYLIHLQATKNASTIDNATFAIKSFFRENDSEISFRFNTKRRNVQAIDDAMTLDELKTILSDRKIQPVERAVFMCKFHRGLDSATFADRFNFDAWQQITAHFGTDDPNMWNISKCPVPIKLVRVKTNYPHTGFLDTDSIVALQEYLKIRLMNKTPRSSNGRSMHVAITDAHVCKRPKTGEALFLDTSGNPISINWIGRRFAKLRKRAGVGKTYSSHEMRDLLKSTLIDSGCRPDVADHVIGHTPKDSYEKQSLLYPESMRTEFAKASDRLNVLSISSHSEKIKQPQAIQTDQKYVFVEASLINDLVCAYRQIEDILLRISHT